MDIIYDTESYPNFWCFVAISADTDDVYAYEISDRCNNTPDLLRFLTWAGHHSRLVGFNNLGYDYPMVHHLMTSPEFEISANLMYQNNQRLIATHWGDRYKNQIPAWKHLIPQVDLFKIHHFDNQNRQTSLKVLEINMQSKNVMDLPFPPGTVLTHGQMQTVRDYCVHDVLETKKFYDHSVKMIEFRDSLSKEHGRDYTNHNDIKIGKDYLVSELEKKIHPEICFSGRPRRPKTTIRDIIVIKDIIFSYIKFQRPEFNHILNLMKESTITETKNVLKKLTCKVNGLVYKFGTGGIHACIASAHIESSSEFAIIDLDVASYYGSLAIENRLFPEHLTEGFCDVYSDLKTQRQSFDKGTPENAMLKLAIVGVYGNSNSQYSPFFDPKFTMGITINGQLLLCMLAEWLLMIPDSTIIQMNTDGLTIKIPHSLVPMLDAVKQKWQKLTNLVLEQQSYSNMWVRDVNNYIAMDHLGNLKRKGDYEYKCEWHQNHSMLVVRKAAEANLVHGADIRGFIENHENTFDFCLTAKIPKTSRLMWGDTQVQNTSRYVVSTGGKSLVKIMPPLGKGCLPDGSMRKERHFRQRVGWVVTMANNGEIDRRTINYDFYVAETEKLTSCFNTAGGK